MKSISIIIVNWNSGEQVRECVESIATHLDTEIQVDKVVIIDNASTDGSAENIINQFLTLQFIRNKENIGFATACNLGARECDSDYILFLNPDTKVYEETLSKVLSFMEDDRNKEVGICGVQLVDNNGQVTPTCSRFPTTTILLSKSIGLNKLLPSKHASQLMVDWPHNENKHVDQVMGAFFLVRRRLFEELSGFDESFFMYFEEVDFAYRAKMDGWQTYYLRDAKAFHRGRGTTDSIKARRLFYSLRSRIVYVHKHFNLLPASIVTLGTLLVEPVSRVASSLMRRSKDEALEAIQGYRMLFASLPATARTAIKAKERRKKEWEQSIKQRRE